jgi:hypothetical protein
VKQKLLAALLVLGLALTIGGCLTLMVQGWGMI